jgi:hypothetical protein
MALEFEWDAAKAASNQRKHGVSLVEAASVFADPLAAIFDHVQHSEDAARDHCGAFKQESIVVRVVYGTTWSDPSHQRKGRDQEGTKRL